MLNWSLWNLRLALYWSICEFNCASNLLASIWFPAFIWETLLALVALNWEVASFLVALLCEIVAAKFAINCCVCDSLLALNCLEAFCADWFDNIACCLCCALRTATCWLLLKLVMSIFKNAWAFNTWACWLLFKLAISSDANLAAFCNVACWSLFKLLNSNVLNKLELEITVCCALFKLRTSIPATVFAFARATAWELFKPAKPTCCCNCALVKAVDCKLAKFCNLTCCCWFAVAITACCAVCKLARPICCSNPAVVVAAFNWFSAFFKSAANCCCFVKTSACCWLFKLAIAVCCSIAEFACAIGIADCIIAFTNASLPIEERDNPLCANWLSTASTAPLAHAGIVPVSIPLNKVSNCEETKVVVGMAATCACTAVGCCIIVADTWAGLVPTAACIAGGNVAVCACTVAAVPLTACAKAPEDNCPWAACAIAWVVGTAVWPLGVAPAESVPCAAVTWDCCPTVPCAAVPVCAVPWAAVIVGAVKAVGVAIAWDCAEVNPTVGTLIFCWPTVVGVAKVEPDNNSFDCTVCWVYACFALSAICGSSILSAIYLSISTLAFPKSVGWLGFEASGIFLKSLVAMFTFR